MTSAKILNVFSGELLEGGIAVKGDRIAYVGPKDNMIGDSTIVVQCGGKIAVPGYIDAHAHADIYTNPVSFSNQVIPLGTTTVLTATIDWCSALGIDGLDSYLELTEKLPLKYFLALPSKTRESYGKYEDFLEPQAYEKYLKNPRILSLAEMPKWKDILDKRTVLRQIEFLRQAGKRIDGHTNGAKEQELNALQAAGISSCHEALNFEEVQNRLRLGYYVLLRHGSIRQELPFLLPQLLELEYCQFSRVMLTPDFMSPMDLQEKGYMDYLISEALKHGAPPARVYQMCTLHPAIYMKLDEEIGSIAPGRIADILLLEDLEHPRPQWVMANGLPVAANGKLFKETHLSFPIEQLKIKNEIFPKHMPLDEKSFRVTAAEQYPGYSDQAQIPALSIMSKTITTMLPITLPVFDGEIMLERDKDVQKVSLVCENKQTLITVFIIGMGINTGAIATTTSLGENKLVIVGANELDMAIAGNRLYQAGGGMIVVKNAETLALCPLEIGGIASVREVGQLAEDFREVYRAIEKLGCNLEDTMVTLRFLTSDLPFFRPTPWGLLDIKANKIIFP